MCAFDKSWEDVYKKTMFGGGYPDVNLIRFMARNLYSRDRFSTRVLEVGCGIGANLWYLAREGFDTFGLDGSSTAVKKCQKRMKEMNLPCHLVVNDACSMQYPDNYFDAVLDLECIYANTLPDIKKILSEVYRVLKKNGLFFSMMFGRETWGYGMGKEIEPHTFVEMKNRIFEGRGMAHFFSEEEIRDIFTTIGFKDLEINLHWRTENFKKNKIQEWLSQAVK